MTNSDLEYRIAAARREELEFTQSMVRELTRAAQGRRDHMLAYLLEMAYVEVSDMIRKEHAKKADLGRIEKAA